MRRELVIARLNALEEPLDVLVIGGGATGFACALDAMSRGYRVALVERYDFGSGTSSRSTKLIHGGVRYLRQGHLGLVCESLRERNWFFQAAPELVGPLEFVIPCRSAREQFYYRAGMRMYDAIAGATGSQRSASLSREEVISCAPGVVTDHLTGGVRYMDGQVDDARLLIAMFRRLVEGQGIALNYAEAVEFIRHKGRVRGAIIEDREHGRTLRIDARVVINAAGVFSDDVARLENPQVPERIAASQGIHLVLDASFLGGSSALMIPKTRDGRVLFAIPWHGRVLYGTTDTPRDRIDDEPQPLEEEIDYLLEHGRHVFSRPPQRGDIIASFAGLRPLPKTGGTATSRISRDFHIVVSDSGLVSVFGGKLTTCRAMGEAAINRAYIVGGLPEKPSMTKTMTLPASQEPASHLEPPGRAWVHHAVENEMARTVDDLLFRRSRVGLLNPEAARASAAQCSRWMKDFGAKG